MSGTRGGAGSYGYREHFRDGSLEDRVASEQEGPRVCLGTE